MPRGVKGSGVPCSIDGCASVARGNGLCAVHYMRFKRNGHGEVEGTEYRAAQKFLNDHLDHKGEDCVIWPFATTAGYAVIRKNKKTYAVHQEVCAHKNGPRPTPDSVVRHKCGRGHLGCINPEHLEWGTRTENALDMAKHGTIAHGANSSSCKLTGRQVMEIYRNVDEHSPTLAARMGVSVQTISDIRNGRSWSWLTKHGQIDPR